MVDISRRNLLKASASIPLLPLLNITEQEELFVYEKCYKIVRNDYTSITMRHEYRLKYEINEWTKPKIGKIFVFSSLIEVKHFISRNTMMCYGTMIFKCDAKNLTKATHRLSDPHSDTIAGFWKLITFDNKPYVMKAFAGTMFCDAVKLIERVEL